MPRQQMTRWIPLLCIGLLVSVPLPFSAQDDPMAAGSDLFYSVLAAGKIAYAAPGADGKTTDIYVMEATANGVQITNLTKTDGADEADPLFSADGRYIAYQGESNPAAYASVMSAYVIGSDGQNKVQITPDGVSVVDISFSPDSTQIAFSALWSGSQFRIYRSDIDGENLYTLTIGEGYNARFPNWRTSGNATEILYLHVRPDGTGQIHALDPLRATSQQLTDIPSHKWVLQPLYGNRYTFIHSEDENHDSEIAVFERASDVTAQGVEPVSAERGAAVQTLTDRIEVLTNDSTDDCCAVWSMDGTVATDMEPAADGIYFLSDTEDGRDIHRVELDGSNELNLTADDDREYTSIWPLSAGTLLVGYIPADVKEPEPRLGLFSYTALPRLDLSGDYTFEDITEGSEPAVSRQISLEQLEGLAVAGLLRACTLTLADDSAIVYSEPRDDAPVVETGTILDSIVDVDAYLPGADQIADGWYHLTDGTWVKALDLSGMAECPPLPRLSRASVGL